MLSSCSASRTHSTDGITSDPNHLVKRKAVGSLSFESFAIKSDGTMLFGDELAPSGGAAERHSTMHRLC